MDILDQLVELSHRVGAPEMDCAILGEGNTSALHEDGTFSVKGSGCCLGSMRREDFVRLHQQPIVDLLDSEASLEDLNAAYAAAKVDPDSPRRPSVETVFHGIALTCPGVRFVAHTHPTAVNGLTCTAAWREHLRGRLCPDEAVVLGPESVYVPYVDPGVALARSIKHEVDAYSERYGATPKAIYLQSHGFIALAGSAQEAYNISLMAVKAARMRLFCLQAGGLNPLPTEVIDHLLGRSDEHYRQSQLVR